MNIELLTDEQFIRHVEALPLTNLEKSLLGRLKWKLSLLDDICLVMNYSEFSSSNNLDHDDILDEIRNWIDKLVTLSKIEMLIEEKPCAARFVTRT